MNPFIPGHTVGVLLFGLSLLSSLTGCTRKPATSDTASAKAEPAAATNRIPVPEAVRNNLGIQFAKVESRHVGKTLRMPGRFEILPEARREYHTPLAGTVELLVKQYDKVTTGTPLYRLDSAEWRRIKQEMTQTMAEVRTTSAALAAARAWHDNFHEDDGSGSTAAANKRVESLRSAVKAAGERVEQLEKVLAAVGGRTAEMAEARNKLAETQAAVSQAEVDRANLDANFHASEAAYESARLKLKLALNTVASYLDKSLEDIMAPVKPSAPGEAEFHWQTINKLEFRSATEGVVEQIALTNGGYVEQAGLVMSTVSPEQIRFRGVALQSDLEKLADGIRARIVPPPGLAGESHEPLPGTLRMGLEADPDERTVDVIVVPESRAHWARAGVTSFIEAVLQQADDPELAIPTAAVIQDELTKVYFRRNPENPDEVIRVEADLGIDDGRWVVVNSGVKEGDEVVTEGVYELKLTGSGKAPQGGHFHADGTFHTGTDH
ncbi:MAG: efflux RND transporter periplasmic adaptor subunit [Candidatus Sumerlaeaceae bacterium]|nr:efflux RND transporter periplasmic adaptor subunit [Candidatus Sumerlaeaceae bacterium]